VRFTCGFGVGDTTQAVCNKYLARQIELVTLNTIFSVVLECSSHVGFKRSQSL
jgi:hypothetical protein